MTPGFTRYAPTAGPSRWLLIAGRRFVACVESTVADSIVDAVWWLAESDLATIESVVGAFPLAAPDSVRSFAVAELGEPNDAGEIVVTAVVRGSAALDVYSVGGARRFGSGGVQPWVLAEFRSVTGLAVGGDDLPTGPAARLSIGSLPLGLGVVDGELLTWSSTPLERVERTAGRGRSRRRTPAPGSPGPTPSSTRPSSARATAAPACSRTPTGRTSRRQPGSPSRRRRPPSCSPSAQPTSCPARSTSRSPAPRPSGRTCATRPESAGRRFPPRSRHRPAARRSFRRRSASPSGSSRGTSWNWMRRS
ncbi:hypothetical protein ACRAWC_00560 [Leifsonia sp. L25]|uniref:hypothetical protein n=1 Tax=Leifsonia sp. L25 TaxID=3423957 RepID=UPI003D6974CF